MPTADGLTILIPNWNHRNYLARSVGSAMAAAASLARHGVAAEVLVYDDDSRDGSQRLLAAMAMADPTGRLHVLLSPVNRGLSGARNFAMAHARYRWACCCDADNELYPDNLIHFYRAARDTGAALVYGNIIHRTDAGVVTGVFSNDVVHDAILGENYVDAMAVLDVPQVTAAGGYRDHAVIHAPEDWELLLHLVAEDRGIVLVPALLGRYHTLEGSLVRESAFNHARVRRMYNQRRVGLPPGFRCRVYHPEVGYLV